MKQENPIRTVLPEAGESEMLASSAEGNIMNAGLEVTLPPDRLVALIDEMRGGELDTEIESAGSVKIQSMQMLRFQVEDILATLSENERRTMELGFGLIDGKQRSAKEVAQELDVSESTARRRIKSATSKLRDPERAQRIKEYLQY
jgi:RNA polymerase primary sigma factor